MNWIGAYDPARYVPDKTYVGRAVSQVGQTIAQSAPILAKAVTEAKQRNISVDKINAETQKVAEQLKAAGIDWNPDPINRVEDLEKWAENNNVKLTQLIATDPRAKAIVEKIGTAMPSITTTDTYKQAVQENKTSEYLGGIVKSAEPITMGGEPTGIKTPAEEAISGLPTIGAASQESPLTSGTGMLQAPKRMQPPVAPQGLLDVPQGAQALVQEATSPPQVDIADVLPEAVDPTVTINPSQAVKENAEFAKMLQEQMKAGLPADKAREMMIEQTIKTKDKYDLDIEAIVDKFDTRFAKTAARDDRTALLNLKTDYDKAINDVDNQIKDYNRLNKLLVKGDEKSMAKAAELAKLLNVEPNTSSVNQAIAARQYYKTVFEARKASAITRAEELLTKETADVDYKQTLAEAKLKKSLDETGKDLTEAQRKWRTELYNKLKVANTKLVEDPIMGTKNIVDYETLNKALLSGPDNLNKYGEAYGLGPMPGVGEQYTPPVGGEASPEVSPEATAQGTELEDAYDWDKVKRWGGQDTGPLTAENFAINKVPKVTPPTAPVGATKVYNNEQEALADGKKSGDVIPMINPASGRAEYFTMP